MSRLVTRPVLEDFLGRLSSADGENGSVFLIGETSQVWESWRNWTPMIELTSAVPHHQRFAGALSDLADEMHLKVIDEFPGDLNERLDALLPRFSMATIQQDPAEFRRKYKGPMQMAQFIVPGSIHRHTPI